MSNQITEWDYETPTQPGLYLACFGDVETPANIDLLTITNSGLCFLDNDSGRKVEEFPSGYKFARLAIGSEAKSVRIAANAEPTNVMTDLGDIADALTQFVADTKKTIDNISRYSSK